MRTELGKISAVHFGHCGYNDAELGIGFTLSGDSIGVQDSRGFWDVGMIKSEGAEWNEAYRDDRYAKIMRYLSGLLKDAKVHTVADLKGIPVEMKFDGNLLKSWRMLKEVI